jgi:hypothetical protein
VICAIWDIRHCPRRNPPARKRAWAEEDDALSTVALTSEGADLESPLTHPPDAGIAQLVEHDLAKVGVASSSLVSRSKFFFTRS